MKGVIMMNLKSLLVSAVLLGVAVPSFAAAMDCCCCKDKKECCEKKMKCCDDKKSPKHAMNHNKMPMGDMKGDMHSMPMDHSDMKMPAVAKP